MNFEITQIRQGKWQAVCGDTVIIKGSLERLRKAIKDRVLYHHTPKARFIRLTEIWEVKY